MPSVLLCSNRLIHDHSGNRPAVLLLLRRKHAVRCCAYREAMHHFLHGKILESSITVGIILLDNTDKPAGKMQRRYAQDRDRISRRPLEAMGGCAVAEMVA